MIYTSYYGNIRNLSANTLTARISRGAPVDCSVCIPWLYPSASLLRRFKAGECSEEDYVEEYLQQLDDVPQSDWVWLLELCRKNGKNLALICFETPNTFCHRHIIAAVLNRMGIAACEAPYKSKVPLFNIARYSHIIDRHIA